MILFFGDSKSKVFAVETSVKLSAENLEKISWALNSPIINKDIIEEKFIGPKSSMISPWSTNAVEITKNMGVESLVRIEEFNNVTINKSFDRMIHQEYDGLNQKVFDYNRCNNNNRFQKNHSIFQKKDVQFLSFE